MSSDERPTKLRKLDDDDSRTPGAPSSFPLQTTAAEPVDSHTAQNKATGEPCTAPTAPSPPRRNLKDPILHALSLANPGLSKNALKKLRRQQEWDAAAPQRRAKRKEENTRRKAAKQASRAAQLAAAGGADPASLLHKGSSGRPRAVQLPVTLLVDCGFDGLMTDGERVSLGAQVTRGYSANKGARWRVHLAVSGWGGKLRDRFENLLAGHYKGWKGTRFEEAGFKDVSEMAKGWMMDAEGGGRLAGPFERYLGLDGDLRKNDEIVDGVMNEEEEDTKEDEAQTVTNNTGAETAKTRREKAKERQKEVAPALQEQGEVVYLTAESPHTLTEMKPYSTYIIGGIVDKNREKGICYKRAMEAGMKTARLPIGDYMEMQSRKVLATNHVLEIMLKWLEYEDWGKAFLEVIPKRKGGQLKGKGGKEGDDGSDSEIEADDVDEIDPDRDAVEVDHVNERGENGNTSAADGEADRNGQ